ncbi:hypothetical protein HK105_208207 [Polyrhizophydium stewartii]|uniref:Uncharacterized protein n=1 Tax=Polyrhizophydium stewartii TaxID=2732419 RepID=A0ABR4MYC1_9FUNG|nr:hypothetical protein HK105_006508 [Polyrhizophydium stewartii]
MSELQHPSSRFPHNPLLVKFAVGKTRPTVYDLPGGDHVYGKRIERDPLENAATVVQHWNVKATSKHAIPALDYITMNRNSAKQGIISPRSIREFRKSNPVRVKVGDHTLYGGGGGSGISSNNGRTDVDGGGLQRARGPLPSDSNPNFTYGKPTRPSTPVAKLMTDLYQREWLEQVERKQMEKTQLDKVRGWRNVRACDEATAADGDWCLARGVQEKAVKKMNSKTAVPRQQALPKPKSALDKDPKTLFKMSKFQKVAPKIVSHRPEDDPAITGISPLPPPSKMAGGKAGRPATTTSRSPSRAAGAATAAATAAAPAPAGKPAHVAAAAAAEPPAKSVSFK